MSDLTAPGGPFEVVDGDVLGVRMRVYKNTPPSLRTVWDASRAHGDRDYLVYEDERITFEQAHRLVASVASHLAERYGVGRGDRVAIAMRNYPEWAISFWATVALGAVAVPLNAWWSGPELAYGLSDSGAAVLFADEERIDRVRDHIDPLPLRAVVGVRTDGELPSGGERWDALTDRADAPIPVVAVDPDDDVTILYTSGTTGKPKGAVGTHRNICTFVMNGMYLAAMRAAAAGATAPSSDGAAEPAAPAPATLLTFPLFHVGGLQSHLVPYTAYGGKLVLMYKWDPVQAVTLIEREDINAFSGVPTTVFSLLEEAARQGRDLSSIAGMSSGATLVPPELVRRIDGQFASRVAPANGYGLTETSGAVIYNAGGEYVAKPESVGRPLSPVIDIRIAGPDGEPVPVGAVGEIWVRGPIVVKGYYNQPEATAAAFTDGWFHTGDLGRVDEDGWYYVVDRAKDVVIRGGENVYAAEVEGALFEHPDVIDVAIIGVPHDRLGEEVGAVVRLRAGADVDADAIRSHVAERLAGFKVPSHVWFRDAELPRNAAGKVLKRDLRDELLSTT